VIENEGEDEAGQQQYELELKGLILPKEIEEVGAVGHVAKQTMQLHLNGDGKQEIIREEQTCRLSCVWSIYLWLQKGRLRGDAYGIIGEPSYSVEAASREPDKSCFM
jgi:hypothetical protein